MRAVGDANERKAAAYTKSQKLEPAFGNVPKRHGPKAPQDFACWPARARVGTSGGQIEDPCQWVILCNKIPRCQGSWTET